jgi:uncharacterized protein YggE
VDNTVFVTLRELSELGDVLDAVIAAGANSINGIQFDVADRTTATADARKAAVADARSQAEELAEAAGVELGEIQSLSTSNIGYPGPVFDGRGAAAGSGSQRADLTRPADRIGGCERRLRDPLNELPQST